MLSPTLQSLVLSFLSLTGPAASEGDIPSSRVRTSDLQMEFAVVQAQGSTLVNCVVRVKNNDTRWDASDRLTCSVRDRSAEFHADSGPMNVDASAPLPFMPNETYKIRLERANGDVVETQILMPGDSLITSPEDHHIFVAGEEIAIRWMNPRFAQEFGPIISLANTQTNKYCGNNGGFPVESKKDSYLFPREMSHFSLGRRASELNS